MCGRWEESFLTEALGCMVIKNQLMEFIKAGRSPAGAILPTSDLRNFLAGLRDARQGNDWHGRRYFSSYAAQIVVLEMEQDRFDAAVASMDTVLLNPTADKAMALLTGPMSTLHTMFNSRYRHD